MIFLKFNDLESLKVALLASARAYIMSHNASRYAVNDRRVAAADEITDGRRRRLIKTYFGRIDTICKMKWNETR